MKTLALLGLVGRIWSGDQPAPRPVLLLHPVAGQATPQALTARLDEVWLSFVPKIQVVPPGSTLIFRAQDADSHTVHAWYGGRTLFNRASVPHGPEQQVVLDQPGVVTVTCDLHAEMRAWVLVSDAAYAAVGDVDGTFSLAAPPGRYRVSVWLPGDAVPQSIGERELGTTPLEVKLAARAHVPDLPAPPRAAPEPPAPRPPEWLLRLNRRGSWPRGPADYVLSMVGVPVGFGLVWLVFWWGGRRRWTVATCVIFGCGAVFVLGALSVAGLSAAVATGLGFGAFLGTVLVGAQRVSLR